MFELFASKMFKSNNSMPNQCCASNTLRPINCVYTWNFRMPILHLMDIHWIFNCYCYNNSSKCGCDINLHAQCLNTSMYRMWIEIESIHLKFVFPSIRLIGRRCERISCEEFSYIYSNHNWQTVLLECKQVGSIIKWRNVTRTHIGHPKMKWRLWWHLTKECTLLCNNARWLFVYLLMWAIFNFLLRMFVKTPSTRFLNRIVESIFFA